MQLNEQHPAPAAAAAPATTVAKRYQAVLACLLLRTNYRNTLLQQHATLLASSSGAAPAAADTAARHARAEGKGPAAFASSFVTRQRREVERGLLDSVVHNKPPPTFLEHGARSQTSAFM
ncbi:hypothetical protein STCU_12171 [Strigomonas culicis]|uniref:Uncharacterized protein n=1 Tax=Strigomonas culicis TaxID=28005 RepID=S9UXL0_9TRYP|nr:hypothetical protein STCU_12171 [Strigomonas culicis]|eukprot:EPY15275.1 hypothetical protein STCU_12171 [Strigomonas culicis]